MKKLIQKLKGWVERNPNKTKIISEISDNSFFCFELLIAILITMGDGLEGLGFYFALKITSLFMSIINIATDMFIEKWKEAKEKDRRDEENEQV